MGFATETGFNTTLAQKLDAGVADSTIILAALPIIVTEGVMLIGSGTNREWAYFATTNGGNVQITGVNRGLNKNATSVSDTTSANILSHRVGDPVRLVQHSVLQNVQFKNDSDNTTSGDNTHTGIEDFDGELNIPIYADAAARDAAITSPREGSAVKLTAEGVITDFLGGVWVTRAADTTANASETVTGRVRLNTAARTDTATDIASGDPTVNKPSEIARVIQDQGYTSGASSAGTDTYVVTLVPAPAAYVTNQMFILEADVTNTGAATVDFNGLGAKSIKLPDGTDPADGDIIVGPNILIYDGTDMILVSATANIAATEAFVTDNNNIEVGVDSFSPVSTASTKVIAHGLGRTPKCVSLDWGSGISAASPEVTVPHGWLRNTGGGTGDTKAISRISAVAGQADFVSVFTIDGVSGAGNNYTLELAFDATNITITVPTFTSGKQIEFIWKAE